jgi:hypothetical protein
MADAILTITGRCRDFLDRFLPFDLSPRLSPIQNTDVNSGLLNLLA